jgi:GNAT superfamily N-acetyltransferase
MLTSVRRVLTLQNEVLLWIASICWQEFDELILAIDLRDLRPPSCRLPSGMRIEEACPHHEGALRTSFTPKSSLAAYLRTGHPGFIAFVGDTPVGYIWYAHRGIPSERRHPAVTRHDLELGEGDLYLFDFYLARAWRGGGVATSFLDAVCTMLRQKGYQRAFGFVDAQNKAARWLYTSMGWQIINRRGGHVVLKQFLYYDRPGPRRLFLRRGAVSWLIGPRFASFDFVPIFPPAAPARPPGQSDKEES